MSDNQHLLLRISRLLRLARDQAGTHEGKTAAHIAAVLQAKHGVSVVLDEDSDDGSLERMIVSRDRMGPWEEFLAESMCAIYRCECVTKMLGQTWQLWVKSDDQRRTSTCSDHYGYLFEQISFRAKNVSDEAKTWRMSDLESDFRATSYAIGLAYGTSKMLLEKVGWRGEMPFSIDGFDQDGFNKVTKDPMALGSRANDDDDQPWGIVPYVHRAPAVSPPPSVRNELPPPPTLIVADEIMFARGCRDARYLDLVPGHLEDDFN